MRVLPTILILPLVSSAFAEPVIIGHAGLQAVDRQTLERIYTGRVVELRGIRVTPINLPPGSATRRRFLHDYLSQDEDKYTGYWTVRRYVGKGVPPRELESAADVLKFVAVTEGAIGYVDAAELTPGVEVLLLSPSP